MSSEPESACSTCYKLKIFCRNGKILDRKQFAVFGVVANRAKHGTYFLILNNPVCCLWGDELQWVIP
jgi:hypothetical protein